MSRLPLVILLAFLAACAPASAATLRVSPPAEVAADGIDPVVVAIPSGGYAIAWVGSAAAPGVFARLRGGAVQQLSDGPAVEVALAAGADGQVAAAWIDGALAANGPRHVEAAVAAAGEAFGATVRLAGGGTDQVWRPRVAVAADGTVAVGYKLSVFGGGEPAMVALRPRGGEFGAPKALWPYAINGPDLAADRDGGIVAMWSASTERDRWSPAKVIQVADRAPGASGFGEPVTLSSPARNADNNYAPPQLAVGSGGDAIVAWSPMPISSGPAFASSSAAAFRPAGGPWTVTEDLVGEGTRPFVAVNHGGDAIVVNQLGPGLGAFFRRAGGSFVPEWAVPLSRGIHMHTPVALDDAGNAVAVDAGTPPAPVPGVVALVRPAGGCFGEEVDVSPRGVVVGRPSLALRGDGSGVVAWAADEGGRWIVRTAGLAITGGGRDACPKTDRPPPGVTLPATRLAVSRTPARVTRRMLRKGIGFRVRAPRGSAVGAFIVPPGQALQRLARVDGKTGRRGRATLRIRMAGKLAGALRRGTKLELWVFARAPRHEVAGRIRKLTVR